MKTRTRIENGICKVYNTHTGNLVYKEIEIGDRIIFMDCVNKDGVSLGENPWRDNNVWATCVNRAIDLLGTVTSVGKTITIEIDSEYQKAQTNCPKVIEIKNNQKGIKPVNIRLTVNPFLVTPITKRMGKKFQSSLQLQLTK